MGIDQKFRKAQTLLVEKLNLVPTDPQAAKIYLLWKRKLTIYTEALEANEEDKFNILINRLDYNTYDYTDNLSTFNEAMAKLDQTFQVKTNTIFARW